MLYLIYIRAALYFALLLKLQPLHSRLPVCLCGQMFKGFDKAKDIQYVYTPVFSSLCGVKLDSNNKAGYLLSGTACSRQFLLCTFSKKKEIQTKGGPQKILSHWYVSVVFSRNIQQSDSGEISLFF